MLTNASGAEITVCNYGGIIVSVMMPDRDGKMDNVVLGLSNIDDMVKKLTHISALQSVVTATVSLTVSSLEGVEYTLPQNNATNCLHGGLRGFSHHVWDAEMPNKQTIVLKYTSVDGEEGFLEISALR